MGCGTGLVKNILIFFNVIFWLSGAVSLGSGIWLTVNKDLVHILYLASLITEDSSPETFAYVLIGFGALAIFVGFIGCCGAWHQNKILLGIYIFFLVVVMAGELAAGIGGAVLRNQIKDNLKTSIQEKIITDKYIENRNADTLEYTPFGTAMNNIQWRFLCCGVEDYKDYKKSSHWDEDIKGESRGFPLSCCTAIHDVDDPRKFSLDKVKNITACYETVTGYFRTTGCHDIIMNEIKSNANVLIGVGFWIVGLEVIVLICAIGLCCCIRKDDYTI